MKKAGRKTLLTILLAGASLLSPKLNGQTINVFNQPNDTTLRYYGSGDANSDNIVNNADYIFMWDSLLWGNDYSDINGDGNQLGWEDFNILEDYLDSTINYLPAHLDSAKSRGERVDWLKKMVEIDETKDIEDTTWACGHYSDQFYLNFHGNSVIKSSSTYNLENNCRFNIPVYTVSIDNEPPIENHAVNATLVGDSIDWNSLYFIEPQTGDSINIGYEYMPENCIVKIRDLVFEENGLVFTRPLLLEFEIIDGNSFLTYCNPNLQLQRNPPQPVDSIAPSINITSPEKRWYSSYPTLEAKLSDNKGVSLDSSYYELYGTKHFVSDSILNEPLASVEGENNLKVYAEDYSQNSTADSLKYFLDTKKPEIFASINPLTQELEYILEDDNLDLSNSYVVLNGGEKFTLLLQLEANLSIFKEGLLMM